MASIRQEGEITDAECRSLLTDGQNLSEAESDEQVIKRIRLSIQNQLREFDLESSEITTSISSVLEPKSKARINNNDDIEIMEQELTEKDFLCPFTTMKFDQPMKNADCSHRISKAGFEAIMKGKKQADCVQPGCRKKWTRASASEDVDFALEMERFFRHKNMISQASQAYASSDNSRRK